MAAVFRDFDLLEDTPRIVTFYNRYGFGLANAMGYPLTDDSFRQMMVENDVVRYQVVDDGHSILGVGGSFHIDAAMAGRPGELRANHFLFENSVRGGTVVGRMLEEGLDWVMDHGYLMTTLRVRPQNKIALFSYLRAGFRAVEHTRAAADGFVDLTTHLPSILGAFRTATEDRRGGIEMPKMNWMVMRSTEIGESKMDDGVEHHPDGSVTVSIHAEPRGMTGEAKVDAKTGHLLMMKRNDEDWTEHILQVVVYEDEPPALGFELPALRLGEFLVDLDTDGGLRVRHPDHLGPVLLDCFPDDRGCIVAYRRPPRRKVATEVLPDGWMTRDVHGAARRIRLVGDDTIEVECRVSPNAPATPNVLGAHPWVGLRTCNLAISTPGIDTKGDHVRTGIWPPYLPGYEACLDKDWAVSLNRAVEEWTDQVSGFGVAIQWFDEGRLRTDGEARATGPVLRYRIHLRHAPTVAPTPPGPALPNDGPAPTWVAGTFSKNVRLKTADGQGEITVSPEEGLMKWQALGKRRLADASASQPFHCMNEVPATVWPSIDTDRTDVCRGPEWAERDRRIRFADPTGPTPGPDEATWGLIANSDLTELEFTTHVPGEYAGQEVSLNFKVPESVSKVELEDSEGNWTKYSRRDTTRRPIGLWWSYTRRLRCTLPDRSVLLIEPLEGPHAEILVRGSYQGFIFVMQSRVEEGGSTARWRWQLTV